MIPLSDPFREISVALRGASGAFSGLDRLKFSKGLWLAGKEENDMKGAELVAHTDQAMLGWCLWQDKKPVEYHVGFVRDRYKPPRRSQLGHRNPLDWEKPDSDPWQFTFYLPLSDHSTGKLYIYATMSAGGRDALANLQEAYADHREFHPALAHQLPLVVLAGDHYAHPEFGRVEKPVFEIAGWVEPPANVKAIKPPASASPMLALEHTESSPASDESENPGEFGADPDEEIPF